MNTPAVNLTDTVGTPEATAMLGYKNASSVTRLVAEHKLVPVTRVAGAFLFLRSDIETLAAERAAS